MATVPLANVGAEPRARATWTPMVIIAMAQILMVFNVATLQVSIDGIATSFRAPATSIGTAIITYSLVVAGLIMLGGRIAEMFGSRRVFRATVVLFGAAMALMAFSPGVATMLVAQVIAGLAAAALVPTLVVLVADNYRGQRQAKALGWLGGAAALGTVLAFLIAGFVAAWIGWRFAFGLLVLFAGAIYKLGDKLSASEGRSGVNIDRTGIVLAAAAVFMISIGASNLTDWGALLATPRAPFSIVDMSPAPVMILCGVFLIQAFVSWSRWHAARGGVPVVSLEVVDTPQERSALFSMFVTGALGSALTFLIPLYIQVVQGGSSIDTAVAVIPFSLASFAAAVLVVRLYGRVSPRAITRYSFLIVAVAIALLGAVIRNDWSASAVMFSMALAGIGEGALVAVLFNVLVTASPKELAGDVGSLRGCTNNLAAGVGTAVAAALVVSLLGTSVHREIVHNPLLPDELKAEADFDLNDVPFVSNDQLRRAMAGTSATEEQLAEAARVNTESRLQALKITFFALAALALLAFFPAGGLPGYSPGEVPGSRSEPLPLEREPAPPEAPAA